MKDNSIELLAPLAAKVHTITVDNGKESSPNEHPKSERAFLLHVGFFALRMALAKRFARDCMDYEKRRTDTATATRNPTAARRKAERARLRRTGHRSVNAVAMASRAEIRSSVS